MPGKYPLSFVQEVQNKLQGQIFATADTRYEALNIHERGTMLPFSEISTAHRKGMVSLYGSLDHPAVKTWTVDHDGSVLPSRVGIVATYPPIKGNDDIAHVLVPIDTPDVSDRARKTPIQYHLNEHLASFQPSRENCVVCLLHQDDRIQGFHHCRGASWRDAAGPRVWNADFPQIGGFLLQCVWRGTSS